MTVTITLSASDNATISFLLLVATANLLLWTARGIQIETGNRLEYGYLE